MFEINKGICRVCKEERILNKNGICIFCSKGYSKGLGKEIKSRTGRIDDNLWMRGR